MHCNLVRGSSDQIVVATWNSYAKLTTGWFRLTSVWPLTPAMHGAGQGFFWPNLVAIWYFKCGLTSGWLLTFNEVQGRSQPHSPGWARVPLSSFFLKFLSIIPIFPQIFLIFVLILALRVGNSPTREGPGYVADEVTTTSCPWTWGRPLPKFQLHTFISYCFVIIIFEKMTVACRRYKNKKEIVCILCKVNL